jgi:hypothetical protein
MQNTGGAGTRALYGAEYIPHCGRRSDGRLGGDAKTCAGWPPQRQGPAPEGPVQQAPHSSGQAGPPHRVQVRCIGSAGLRLDEEHRSGDSAVQDSVKIGEMPVQEGFSPEF